MTEASPTAALQAFVAAAAFPCVGAKAALGQHRLTTYEARDIRCRNDDHEIHAALRAEAAGYRDHPQPFRSLAVLFAAAPGLDETDFETALWQRLQSLSDIDVATGHTSDPRVSAHPTDPDFAPSFADEAFYIVGLHPCASRPSRRFERPAIIFNIHNQFTALREVGRFERIRERVTARDVALAGSRNPMLADHGTASAASQYSGRRVEPDWSCPYMRRDPE